MQRKIFNVLAFAVGLFSYSNTFADNNKLALQDVMLPLGNTEATLSVLLFNEDQIAGFQCDLYLPDGVEVTKDGNGDFRIELFRTTSNRHNISARLMTDGALRLLCTSMTNATFAGNSGVVLNLTLKAKKGLAEGNYVMSLRNIVLTNPDANRLISDNTSSNLKVVSPVIVTAKSYTRKYGDANPEFGYTVSGAALAGEPEIICEATPTSPVGEYPIIIKKGSVSNYNDMYVNGTLTSM